MRSETGKMPKVNGMRFSRIVTTRLSMKQSGPFVGSDLDRFVPRGSPADSQLVCPVTFHCSVVSTSYGFMMVEELPLVQSFFSALPVMAAAKGS